MRWRIKANEPPEACKVVLTARVRRVITRFTPDELNLRQVGRLNLLDRVV